MERETHKKVGKWLQIIGTAGMSFGYLGLAYEYAQLYNTQFKKISEAERKSETNSKLYGLAGIGIATVGFVSITKFAKSIDDALDEAEKENNFNPDKSHYFEN